MSKQFIYVILLLFVSTGCNKLLEQDPDQILTDEEIYGDEIMLNSVLANFYDRIQWGQHIGDPYSYTILDEAGRSDGGADNISDYANDLWRVYDYGLIRDINKFLVGLRNSELISESDRLRYEGETRFIRAWLYFNMAKGLGGVPLVGDKVFEYVPGEALDDLQYPRATESDTYKYVISEMDDIHNNLSDEKTINAARVNKWAALMLKARASIYAASLAKYNNLLSNPIKTTGGEVGIAASEAQGFYETALEAAEEVYKNSPYELSLKYPEDLQKNFYDALNIKENNVEVIWAKDHIYPGQTTGFTRENIPASHAEDIDRAYAGPILNLVEDFEYKDNRLGQLKIKDANGDYIYYSDPLDLFEDKDARLGGTVILPGADFRGEEVLMQAGQKNLSDGKWVNRTSQPGGRDASGQLITSINGPVSNNEQHINKTGFHFRKFLDETSGASTRGRNSEMWYPRFRFAEAILIAAEASLELGNKAEALKYLNQIRERAGIQDLQQIDIDDIIQERRVELAFEDHRYWDMKRFRRAHLVWNGSLSNEKAVHYALFPYKIVAEGHPQNGKWVFEKVRFINSPNARNFQMRNYYNFIDQDWINNNPNIVKNPYQ